MCISVFRSGTSSNVPVPSNIFFAQQKQFLLLCVRYIHHIYQITANVSLMCLVVQATENFLQAVIYFLFVDGIGNRDWRQFIPLCNNTAFRLCMDKFMNSCHFSRLCLMFIAAIRPSMFLQAWVHLVLWRTAQNHFGGSEMLSLSQCRPEDFTVEVLKTTVLLYSSTVLGLWWGQQIVAVWSCVVQQRFLSGKILDLFK
jgi:hypothetical protein